MKNKQIISPIGLKGNQIHERQLSLMGIKPITENENKGNHAVELTKMGPDGNAYAIIRENHEYYIKRTNKTTGLVLEDFKYIGGLQNKKDEAYPSYAKAIKQLNLKFKSLSESYNRGGDINVFEDDNLLEHHPLKADQGFSEKKGLGDNQEYVVDKKGTPLSNKAKVGKEKGQFGDNLADGKACDDCEEVKVNEGFGFTGEGNLVGDKPMVDDVELNEFEEAIEEMMARYDEEEEMSARNKELAAKTPPYDEITHGDKLNAIGVFEEDEEDDYVDYTMGNEEDPNQLPNPPREINIPEELHGGQRKFDALNSMEESIKRLDALLEGELKKKALK